MNIIGQNGNTGEHYDEEFAKNVSELEADVIMRKASGDVTVTSTTKPGPCSHDNTIPEFERIREWAVERGLYEKGDAKTQFLKLQEETGEVARAILKQDEAEIVDGLGDTLVVLINLAHLCGYRLEDCLQSAYDVIQSRTGSMKNGTFVKDA